jgi:uncharacterized glyoxalase superfamily protein PhnB
MAAAKITGSAPILLVKDVQRAADHYRDALGFSYDRLWGDPPNFCILTRDGHRLFLAQVDAGTDVTPHWRIVSKMSSAYFWVDDAEALYEEFQRRGATIDWSLYTTPYGVKEFGIQDIDGHDIAFGEVLHRTSSG